MKRSSPEAIAAFRAQDDSDETFCAVCGYPREIPHAGECPEICPHCEGVGVDRSDPDLPICPHCIGFGLIQAPRVAA
jgi:hypothetical protein